MKKPNPKQAHLDRFFQKESGRTMLIPIDHGTIIPVPGLESPGALIEMLKPYADGFIVTLGTARRFSRELEGCGIVLRTDTGNTFVEGLDTEGSFQLYGGLEAEEVGAQAMMNMCYPGHANEASIIRDCADLIAENLTEPHVIMLETLPYGLGRGPDYTPENIEFCIRLSCELGADVVKTAYPGDEEAFRRAVAQSFVPVVVLGGASGAKDQPTFLGEVAAAMRAGASGIAIGRNLWQAPDPVKMAKALRAIVHENASADQATSLL